MVDLSVLASRLGVDVSECATFGGALSAIRARCLKAVEAGEASIHQVIGLMCQCVDDNALPISFAATIQFVVDQWNDGRAGPVV